MTSVLLWFRPRQGTFHFFHSLTAPTMGDKSEKMPQYPKRAMRSRSCARPFLWAARPERVPSFARNESKGHSIVALKHTIRLRPGPITLIAHLM